MNSHIKSVISLIICILLIFPSSVVNADTNTLPMIEAIIAGKQDKLVFATIVSIGDSVCSVEVMEEIGEEKRASNTSKDDSYNVDEDKDKLTSVVGEKIEVEGLKSYMYYEGFDHRPKKGDNVLLSLTFSGNVYKIKNGAFYVNAASHDTFNFIVPDTIDGTQSAMELTALYRFVGSDGKNADYTIKNSAVYTHDTANNGLEIKIEEQEGITFVNEKGETTKEADVGGTLTRSDAGQNNPYSWLHAIWIIILGAIVGMFIVKLVIKLEKRSELK